MRDKLCLKRIAKNKVEWAETAEINGKIPVKRDIKHAKKQQQQQKTKTKNKKNKQKNKQKKQNKKKHTQKKNTPHTQESKRTLVNCSKQDKTCTILRNHLFQAAYNIKTERNQFILCQFF